MLTPKDASRRRVEKLNDELAKLGFHAYLCTSSSNIQYLTARSPLRRAVYVMVLTPEAKPVLFTSQMERMLVEAAVEDMNLEILMMGGNLEERLAERLRTLRAGIIGFDELSFFRLQSLRKKLPKVEFKPRPEVLSNMRQVKDEAEVEALKAAARLADVGLEAAVEAVKAGVREYDVAAEGEYAMRKRGAEGLAFDTTVASGPRSSLPHGGTTNRKLRDGDTVVIDIGARFAGYHSDLTRTVFVGKPSPRQVQVYWAVCRAQSEALKSLSPGLKGWEVDAVARKILGEEGFEAYFIHGLGHGVGVDIHEAPKLSIRSKDTLRLGNVVTVEPGVYLHRKFGVRIEDTVLVASKGPKVLTKSQKRVY